MSGLGFLGNALKEETLFTLMKIHFIIAFSILLIFGCYKSPQMPPAQAPSQPRRSLKESEARKRTDSVSNVSYRLWFYFERDQDSYRGKVNITFDLKGPSEDLFIEFNQGRILSFQVNHQSITAKYDQHRIWLNDTPLKNGKNQIEIQFDRKFNNNGNGLHLFKDPVDGSTYFYSNLEPYKANQVFPCFDQPDLKATYRLSVEAPKEWEIIANQRESLKVMIGEGQRRWEFPRTKRFSTYIFALMGGPFVSWASEADRIPLRLFARKAVKKYVDSKDWFLITEEGMRFFHRAFGYPYPFEKYDQILVPDFNAGAMENVGAVTFSEDRYVNRSKITLPFRRRRASVILHEMAHMWFGNLVTMRWWNDLWLNESFATFSAAWALDDIGPRVKIPGSWQSFFRRMKGWAYWEDQLVTSHPIKVSVPDTEHASAIFDGITYGKGAAVLKQLYYFLGKENFSKGLHYYFTKHAFLNTELKDFVAALTRVSSKDLSNWQKAWLQSNGVNPVQLAWSCSGDQIKEFRLIQRESIEDPSGVFAKVLRTHRTQIALYYKRDGKLRVGKVIAASYSGSETLIKKAIGQPCPELVYPNHKDYDYVKVILDPHSVETVRAGLSDIVDPFARQMLWQTLWDAVVDGQTPAQRFIETTLHHLDQEKNPLVLRSVIRNLISVRAGRASSLSFLDEQIRAPYRQRIENRILSKLETARPGSDLQLFLFRRFLTAAASDRAKTRIQNWLSGNEQLHGLKIDQERRWDLLHALSRMGAPGLYKLVEAEKKRDPSDRGVKRAIRVEASFPNRDNKMKWLKQIMAPANERLPISKLRVAMRNYHLLGQEELTRFVTDAYFERLRTAAKTETGGYQRNFSRRMFPPNCDQDVVDRTARLLENPDMFPARVVKILRIHKQETERCIRARRLSRALAQTR